MPVPDFFRSSHAQGIAWMLAIAAVGFALFGERPEIWTWIGGTVIFASTVFLARGEAKTGRSS